VNGEAALGTASIVPPTEPEREPAPKSTKYKAKPKADDFKGDPGFVFTVTLILKCLRE
jgi:hypothetical protein